MTATGSYLEGLEPFGGNVREMSVTKYGLPIFDGSPHQYEDWKAKVEAAVAGASLSKEDDRNRELALVGLHVFQALQGDASRVVRDKLGSRECVVPDGAAKVVQVLEQEIFHRRRDLAKDLNRQGTQTYGLLSRSAGEPMSQYVTRREKWWRRVQEMGQGSITLCDTLRAEYLLQAARLSDDQKTHVLSSCSENPTVEETTRVLLKLYSTLHEKETKRVASSPTYTANRATRQPWKGKWASSTSSGRPPNKKGIHEF